MRLHLALLATLIACSPASAEEAPAASSPNPPPAVVTPRAAPTVFTLTVTPQEAQMVWGALGQLPYAQVAPLMERLKAQIQEQERSRASAPADPAK